MTEYRRAGNSWVKQLYSVQEAMNLIPWITNKQTTHKQLHQVKQTERKEPLQLGGNILSEYSKKKPQPISPGYTEATWRM